MALRRKPVELRKISRSARNDRYNAVISNGVRDLSPLPRQPSKRSPDETKCNPGRKNHGFRFTSSGLQKSNVSESERATALTRVRAPDESARSRIDDNRVGAPEALWIPA